jgi:hypothetical protein
MAERLSTPLSERVKITDKEQAKSVVEQHDFTFSSFVQEAFSYGVLILSMLKGPDEQSRYGKYTGEQLARKLRPITVLLIDFLSEHGVIPSNLSPTIVSFQTPPPTMGAVETNTKAAQESKETAHETEQPVVDQEEVNRLGSFGVVSRKRKKTGSQEQQAKEH